MAARRSNKPDPARNLTPIGTMRKLAELTGAPEHWANYEKAVRGVLAEADGNVSRAARLLGVSRRTMQRIVAEPRFADIDRASPGRPADGD